MPSDASIFLFGGVGGGWQDFSQISAIAGSFPAGDDLLGQWWPMFRWVWDAHSLGQASVTSRAQTGSWGKSLAPVPWALATLATDSKSRENLAEKAGSA